MHFTANKNTCYARVQQLSLLSHIHISSKPLHTHKIHSTFINLFLKSMSASIPALFVSQEVLRNMWSESTTSHRTEGQLQRLGGHGNDYIHHCDTHRHSSWIRGFKCRAMVGSTIIHNTIPTRELIYYGADLPPHCL